MTTVNVSWIFAAMVLAFVVAASVDSKPGMALAIAGMVAVLAWTQYDGREQDRGQKRVRFADNDDVRTIEPQSPVRCARGHPTRNVDEIIANADKEFKAGFFGKLVDWQNDIRLPENQSVLAKDRLDEYFTRATMNEFWPLLDNPGPYRDLSVKSEDTFVGPRGWFRDPMPTF